VSEPEESTRRLAWLASLRTARSAAIAGLVFAVSFTLTIYLLRSAFPVGAFLATDALPSADDIARAQLGVNILPYVGIAFLWFTAVLNYSVGHADNRLFTTVFTGSGIAFIVILFVIGALASAELRLLAEGINPEGASRIVPASTINELLASYAPRMAAVFALSLSTLGRLRKVLPGWLTAFGTVTGLVLLLVPFGVPYVEYLFPAWALVVSVYLFIADPGGKARASAGAL
jgi:hypothetical protein